MRGNAGSVDTKIKADSRYTINASVKPPLNKAIGETFKREKANVLR